MNHSDKLPTEWLKEIAKSGTCYRSEAKRMAEELLELRESSKEDLERTQPLYNPYP